MDVYIHIYCIYIYIYEREAGISETDREANSRGQKDLVIIWPF